MRSLYGDSRQGRHRHNRYREGYELGLQAVHPDWFGRA